MKNALCATILLYRICHTVHQSKWLKYTNFSLHVHVHEFGTMSVMIVFSFIFLLRMHHYFVVICVTTSRYKCGCIKHTKHTYSSSAVHSVSDAVSVVFVSEGFTNTNVV